MSVSQPQADGLARPVPRLRPRLRVAIAIAVVLGLVAIVTPLWKDHERAEHEHAWAQLFARYMSAEAALARLMPADVTGLYRNKGCTGICGFSKLDPPQVAAQLRKQLPGSKLYTNNEAGCPASAPCVAQVEGHIHGFEVAGIVFWHLLVLPYSQTPPPGAIELRPRFNVHRHRHGAKRGVFLGSEVDLLVREPAALSAETE